MRKVLTLIFVIQTVVSFSQKTTDSNLVKSKKVNYGILTKDEYLNTFFGLRIPYPSTWKIQDSKSTNRLQKNGNELLKDHADLSAIEKEALDISGEQTLKLFVSFKYKIGIKDTFNPSFSCIAFNFVAYPQIKTAQDVQEMTKSQLKSTNYKTEFSKDIYKTNIGGKEFAVLEYKIDMGNGFIANRQYVTMLNGYALYFILNYKTDKEFKEVNDILSKIKFW
jgi:hypothetical protein